ncbi:MAG: ABC transporter substrate-binding protein [Candidatus Aminicenantes bacterium]|nr:ABC transporter substrate-binding protein [Candidatus Aminicenantes bacterium]
MKKNVFLFLIFICIPFFFKGCSKGLEKNTLRVGIHTFPASLNPVYVTDETSQAVVNKIFHSLFYYDSRGTLKNGLVSRCHLKNKGKEIIIELKENIFFSNGCEMTADDLVHTINLLKDRRFKYPYAANISFIKEVKRIDKTGCTLILNKKTAVWKNYLTFHILNAQELKNVKPEDFRHMRLSGCGYYKIKEIKEPQRIVLELKTPAENPSLYSFIEYQVIKNTGSAPLKLLNDEIDICELQPETVAAYRNIEKWQKKFTISNYTKFGYTYLVFNLKSSAVNRDTRKFFYNVLTCGDFIDKFLAGRGEKVKTPFLLLNRKIDAAAFKTAPPKELTRLKVLTNSESKLRKDFVLFLKKELKPYNIHLEPLFLEYHTFLHYLKNSRFDIAVSAFLVEIDYDMKDIFYGGAAFNYATLNNPHMNALLDQGLTETDIEKREDIYRAAHKIWLTELPLVPLFNLYYYIGISRNIPVPPEVYELVGSTGDFLFNIEDWIRSVD